MVLRLLYHENIRLEENVPPLTQLGYTPAQVSLLDLLVVQPSGIIFVSGPTGSGKSTTLKYIIQKIASDPRINFMSIEDPVEYNIPGVRQIAVSVRSNNSERKDAFAKAIRAALRSDPDRIMIGEIRDTSSAEIAVECAQTGHQVWTSVHATSTFGILDRMLAILIGEKYSERRAISLLSDASIVNGLLFQRLAPILCDHCKVALKTAKDRVPALVLQSLRKSLGEAYRVQDTLTGAVNERATAEMVDNVISEQVFILRPDPQHRCDNPLCAGGTVGRTVVSELVYTNPALLEDVFTKSSAVAKRLWNAKNRNETLQANARKLILAGQLDPAKAIEIVGQLEADIIEREE